MKRAAKKKIDPRPVCRRCGRPWTPREGQDATVELCSSCMKAGHYPDQMWPTKVRVYAALGSSLEVSLFLARPRDPKHHDERTYTLETKAKQDAEDEWVSGYAVALAEVHRASGDSTNVCVAARSANLTIAMAKKAGVADYDLKELRRAGVASGARKR